MTAVIEYIGSYLLAVLAKNHCKSIKTLLATLNAAP